LNAKERLLLEQAVVESLGVANEDSDNVYHRMHLVRKQLKILVAFCGLILAAALWAAYFLSEAGGDYDWNHLAAVFLAGALGGVVSAMFQLSRVGTAKIPDALLYGLITSGRPLLGAASALFIYLVMQSKLISIIKLPEGTDTLAAGCVVGFIAGFSERLLLLAVGKVAGTEKDDSTESKRPAGRAYESSLPTSSAPKPK
jgi:hypothetical protein